MTSQHQEGMRSAITGIPHQRAEEEVAAAEECTSLSTLPTPGLTFHIARFAVQGSPNNELALSNCLVVCPSDFPDGQHVLVKQAFPLTTR